MFSQYYTAPKWCTPNLIPDSNSLILRLFNEVSFFPKFILKSVQKTQNIKLFKRMNACKSWWLQFDINFFVFFGLKGTKMHYFCKIIVKFKYISSHKGMHWRSMYRNYTKITLLATFFSLLASLWPVLYFDFFDHLSNEMHKHIVPH